MAAHRKILIFVMAGAVLLAGAGVVALQSDTGPAVQTGAVAVMSPPDALAAARTGERLLIDLRTPREWRETGVPAPARLIDYNATGGGDAFAQAVLDLVDGDKGRPVAVICATGGRSARAWQNLKDAGFSNVQDVSEGMLGGRNGPGWLARTLPTRRWNDDDMTR